MGKGDAANIIGSASVEITAEVVEGQFQQAVDNALKDIKARIEAELHLTLAEGGLVGSGGSVAPAVHRGKGKASEQGVDANVASVNGLEKAIHTELKGAGDGLGFKLPVNSSDLRAQVQAALLTPFKIKLDVDGQVGAQAAIAPHPTGVVASREVSEETAASLRRALQGLPGSAGDFSGQVNGLYQALDTMFRTHKGGPFGEFSTDPGNEEGKTRELVEAFGPINTWGQLKKRGVEIGDPVMEELQSRGLSRDQVNAGINAQLAGVIKQSAGNTAAGMPFAEISRRMADDLSRATHTVVSQTEQAPAAPAPTASVAAVAAEARAALTSMAASRAETPTPDVVAPETRGEAKVLLDQSLDEALGSLRQTISRFPEERHARTGKGSQSVFDFDPETGNFLSTEEIRARNGGQLPNPPGFTRLLGAASNRAFNNRAEVVNARGQGTGRYVLYDPEAEDQETQRLRTGNIGNIPSDPNDIDPNTGQPRLRRARGIRPGEYARRLITASMTGTTGQLVRPEDMTSSGQGDTLLNRVIDKLIGPQASLLESRAPRAVKFGTGPGSGERGKLSGTLASSGLSVEDAAALDQQYLKAWESLKKVRDQIFLDTSGTDRAPKASLAREEASRAQEVARLEDRGADPSIVNFAYLPPSEQAAVARSRRASQAQANLDQQARIKSEAAPDVTRKQAMDYDIALPAIDKMVKFSDAVRGGKLPVSRETLPPGYEVRDTEELNRSTFVRQHLASIMDEFRGQIGEPTTGRLDVPHEFKSTFGPVISAVFRDLVSEPGPGNPALRAGTSPGTRRSLSSITFPEQERTTVEASAYRQSRRERPIITTLDQERARARQELEPYVTHQPIPSTEGDLLYRRAPREQEIGRQLDIFGGAEPVFGRDQVPESEPSEPGVPVARGQRALFPDIAPPKQRLEDIRRIQHAARRLILRESGQLPVAQNLREATAKEVQSGRYESGQMVPGAFVRSSPTFTGEETAERILARTRVPDVVRREALEQIESGIAPGLTIEDVRRREARARGQTGMPQGPSYSGDDNREATDKGGAFVADLEQRAGAAGGGRGKPPTLTGLAPGGPNGEGAGRSDFGHGVVHVIVDNSVLRVAWDGAGPSSGMSGKAKAAYVAAGAGDGAEKPPPPEITEDGSPTGRPTGRRRKNITTRDIGTAADLGRVYTFDPEVYEEQDRLTEVKSAREREAAAAAHVQGRTRQNDAGIAAAMRRDRAAESLAAQLARENSGADIGSRNARRQQLGLDPLLSDVTSKDAQDADDERSKLAATSNAANRRILRRGFTASVTDLIQAPAFEKQVQAVNAFNREAGQLGSLLDKLAKSNSSVTASEEELAAARSKGNKNIDQFVEALERERRGRDQVQKQVDVQRERVVTAQGNLPSGGDAARNLAVGGFAAAGAFGLGSVVFQMAGQVLGVAEQAISSLLGPAIERALGNPSVTAGFVGQAGQAAAVGGGRPGIAEATFAQQLSVTPEQAAQFATGITSRGEIEEGNKRLAALGGAFRAARNIDTRGVGGVFTGTSGIADSVINQVPGTAEVLAGISQGFTSTNKRPEPFLYQPPEPNNKPSASFLPFELPFGLDNTLRNITNPQAVSAVGPGAIAIPNPALPQFEKDLASTSREISVLNDGLKRGGDVTHKFATELDGITDDELKAQANALRAAGDVNLAPQVEARQLAILGDNGRPETNIANLSAALTALPKGLLQQSPENLIALSAQDRKAQVFGEQQQLQFQTGTQIPVQFAIQQALQPIGNLLAPLRAAGIRGPVDGIGNLQNQINADATTGQKQAIDFVTNGAVINGQQTGGLGAEAGADFAKSLALAASYGKQISDLQIKTQTEQAAYAAEQYAYQIKIATRSLSDAKGLTGEITGNTRDNLGVLERQQFLLQRQSQSLSLGLSQTQVNFQRSLAGFTAPGDTPEERSARIEQAKIEADYAQKQLNIQKQLFGLSGRTFNITASRQVRDLVNQVGLLEKGREVQLDTARAEAKVRALTVLQSKENQRVEAYYQAAVQRTNDVLDLEKQLVSATSAGLSTVTRLAINAFAQTYAGIIKAMNPGERPNSIGPDVQLGRASGAFFMTQGQTSLGSGRGIAGEAGGEAIAVISAPKQFNPAAMMGGGMTTIINVTGNTLQSDKDIDTLVYKIERALNRKGALMGYNRPF